MQYTFRCLVAAIVVAPFAAWAAPASFEQPISRQFRVSDGLPSNDVRSVAVARNGEAWAATARGVSRLREGRWEAVDESPATAIAAVGSRIYAVTKDGVVWFGDGAQGRIPADGERITAVYAAGGGASGNAVWLLSPGRIRLWRNSIAAEYPAPAGVQLDFITVDSRGRPVAGGRIAAAGCSDGERGGETAYLRALYRLENGRFASIGASRDVRGRPANRDFLCAAADSAGQLWIGTRGGVAVSDGAGWFQSFTGREGLPVEEVQCLALAPGGDLWAGTPEGICRLSAGRWSYFAGRRWLPGDSVRQIAIGPDGSAWIATGDGVAHIELRRMTLAEKAAHYEQITAARHNRNGFVTVCRFRNVDDPGSWEIEASDNDGIWTALYCAAESFRFAVTREPAARESARRSMKAILELERLSGIPGFPARAVVRKGETRVYLSQGEWHDSPVDPRYRWKGDTSSDELDGHYFIYGIFYDLVADEQEKSAIRTTVARITDHLLKNGYRLMDLDGKPTRWAIFGPKELNDDPDWEEQRCLNSLSILKNLRVAHHITGDPRYAAAIDDLVQRHHYLINAVNQKQLPPAEINHSDDQLAFLSYYALLRYEKDANRRRLLLMSLERSWQIERPERNPFFNFVYGAAAGKRCDAESAEAALREWPWDLRHWDVRNSRRADVQISPLSTAGRLESTRALPAGERRAMQWSDNPFVLDGGDGGRREYDGAAWLLAYWLGRYHGLVD